MPLPLKLIAIPALKIVLLGLLKSVLILLGALVLPVFTLKFLLASASGIIRPHAKWLRESEQHDSSAIEELEQQLSALQAHQLDRTQSRAVLMSMVRDTATSVRSSLAALGESAVTWTQRALNFVKSGFRSSK